MKIGNKMNSKWNRITYNSIQLFSISRIVKQAFTYGHFPKINHFLSSRTFELLVSVWFVVLQQVLIAKTISEFCNVEEQVCKNTNKTTEIFPSARDIHGLTLTVRLTLTGSTSSKLKSQVLPIESGVKRIEETGIRTWVVSIS